MRASRELAQSLEFFRVQKREIGGEKEGNGVRNQKKKRSGAAATELEREKWGTLFSLFLVFTTSPPPPPLSPPLFIFRRDCCIGSGPATGVRRGGRGLRCGAGSRKKISTFLIFPFFRSQRERERARERDFWGGVISFFYSFSRFSLSPHNHVQSKRSLFPPSVRKERERERVRE